MIASFDIVPLGDRAVVIHLGDAIGEAVFQRVRAVASQLEQSPLPGVTECVPAFTTVTLHYDPLRTTLPELVAAIEQTLRKVPRSIAEKRRTVEIPVCYGGEFGEDLAFVAEHNGLTPEEVLALHTANEYRVYLIGFTPGFPYLGGMSPRIAAPRRATPRLTVPAGSVGIAGEQTGVYPLATPGGWQLIGRTPLAMFRPSETPPSLLKAGDFVRFRAISADEFVAKGSGVFGEDSFSNMRSLHSPKTPDPLGCPSIQVVRPGLLTTVQDSGRCGYQQYGVAVGGAMDRLALRMANLLVGNDESAAGLEITLLGPTLAFEHETLIAISGGDLSPSINGQPLGMDRPIVVAAGTQLTFGPPRRGCRAYLAITGGIDVPLAMNSRSTYLLAGIGGLEGRALQAGDGLPIGAPGSLSTRIMKEVAQTPAHWFAPASFDDAQPIRVVRGAEFERLTSDAQQRLFSETFRVNAESNRMGFRLAGPSLELVDNTELISAAVCPGTIQVPPRGEAILLMAECATTGGYAKVAHVIAADLPRAAQLKPGDAFHFREVSLAEAHQLFREQEHAIRCLKAVIALRYC